MENLASFQYQPNNTVPELIENLERFSQQHETFDGWSLVPLFYYPNVNVRVLAVKTLGKLHSTMYIKALSDIVGNDKSSIVKREAVSSIGRMRSEKAVDTLIAILQQPDPKVVCQAIRGLLVFKGNPKVDDALKALANHENEMVSSVINKEYFSVKTDRKQTMPHTYSYPFLQNVVVNADVLKVLDFVPDDSIHLTFTSPPYYNARDYSIYPSYEAYLHFLQDVFEKVLRVTKEGRFLIVNTSPVIVPRISRQHQSKRYPIPFDVHAILIKLGWDFIDDIVWLKPEYSVKNRIGGFEQHRKPLAYKPNSVTEYLMVYRKHTDKLLDWNMHQYSLDVIKESKVEGKYETSNVWAINPKSDKVHSAVFPEELCKRVVEYYSYKGDLVFDPFGGSGTLGRTARALGRYAFLAEMNPNYFEYMKTFESNKSMFEVKPAQFLNFEQFKNSIQL